MMGFWGGWSLVGVYFFNLIFSYMYDIFPAYLVSFIIKTLANVGAIYVAINYYGGWKDHRTFKIHEAKEAKAEEASPFSFAM